MKSAEMSVEDLQTRQKRVNRLQKAFLGLVFVSAGVAGISALAHDHSPVVDIATRVAGLSGLAGVAATALVENATKNQLEDIEAAEHEQALRALASHPILSTTEYDMPSPAHKTN